MSWFKSIFGFEESHLTPSNFFTYFKYTDQDYTLTSLPDFPNSNTFYVGPFECLPLSSFAIFPQPINTSSITFKHIIGDVYDLINDKSNAGAVFQVASQFNCLEMISPKNTPSQGITQYIFDHTQGPISAMRCPGGLLYRNYIDILKGQRNNLDLIENYIDNKYNEYWKVQNGYCLLKNDEKLKEFNEILKNDEKRQEIINNLKVGIHWNTQVGVDPSHRICQVFCSALPISYTYSIKDRSLFKEFAQVILDTTYDITFRAASILALEKNQRIKVFLTFIGGGVFCNEIDWIMEAIAKSLKKHCTQNLDVFLVHYAKFDKYARDLVPDIEALYIDKL